MSSEPPQRIAEPPRQQPGLILQAQRSGPLPAPSELEHYERICPGAAHRIISVMEREQEHRHNRENSADAVSRDSGKRGQWLGGAVILAAIAGAVIDGVLHGPWQIGVALVSVPVLSGVEALIRGRNDR